MSVADKVFPHGPKTVVREKRQDVLYPSLRAALELRSRVFHHEQIYHWTLNGSNPSLKQRHNEICEVISWMCPVHGIILEQMDRFVTVHDAGSKQFVSPADYAFLLDEERTS